jgi:hypothetical protein
MYVQCARFTPQRVTSAANVSCTWRTRGARNKECYFWTPLNWHRTRRDYQNRNVYVWVGIKGSPKWMTLCRMWPSWHALSTHISPYPVVDPHAYVSMVTRILFPARPVEMAAWRWCWSSDGTCDSSWPIRSFRFLSPPPTYFRQIWGFPWQVNPLNCYENHQALTETLQRSVICSQFISMIFTTGHFDSCLSSVICCKRKTANQSMVS